MPRPCATEHVLQPGRCRFCYWCVSDTVEGKAFRVQWGEPEPSGFPSAVKQALTYSIALARHLAGGSAEVTPEIARRRLEVCEACYAYRPAERRCGECGCYVEIKSNWETSFCPLGKWKYVEVNDNTLIDSILDPLNPELVLEEKPNWANDWFVRDAHVKALGVLLQQPLSCERKLFGRGIVYVGGGKYWPMIVLGIRKARKYTDIPIQVWLHGQYESFNAEDLDGLGEVTIHDVLSVQPRPRRSGGWENKTTALLHCGFERALFLDGDAYLCSSPHAIFELLLEERFVCWNDLPWNAQTVHWEWTGVVNENRVGPIQGGQLGINVERFWPELVISHWINQHSDYFYAHQYGDQDSWRIALAATKGRYRTLGPAEWHHPAFVCRFGETTIVHRCQGKFWDDGRGQFNPGLPDELDTRRKHEELFIVKGSAKEVFTQVYRQAIWGPDASSGGGSLYAEFSRYLNTVDVMRRLAKWETAVDLGCGDGKVSEHLPFPRLIGIDCYEPHITRLKRERPDVQWLIMDIDTEREGIPMADVCLMRDVLHHWPTDLVVDWVQWARKCGRWKHVVFSQDVHQQADGEDCRLGGYRALNPGMKPLQGLGLHLVAEYLHKAIFLLECV